MKNEIQGETSRKTLQRLLESKSRGTKTPQRGEKPAGHFLVEGESEKKESHKRKRHKRGSRFRLWKKRGVM